MIRFIASGPNDRKMLGLVLSDMNIEELKKGNPIFFHAEDMNSPSINCNEVAIMYYPTEEDAKADFASRGFITEATIMSESRTKH